MIEPVQNITKSSFEKLYSSLRKKEGRIYTDTELLQLPNVAITHQHYKEWKARKVSSQELIHYLIKQNRPLDILEIGCGNGWLSHRLSAIPASTVIGLDINSEELKQAINVFGNIPNLSFIYGDIDSGVLINQKFDVIVFAASIQYFPVLTEIISRSLTLLKPVGEIHILDSHFYSLAEADTARQRSLRYYETIGFPEMADWYFHHRLDELNSFNYSILYNPKNLFNKFLKSKYPFYWVRILQKEN